MRDALAPALARVRAPLSLSFSLSLVLSLPPPLSPSLSLIVFGHLQVIVGLGALPGKLGHLHTSPGHLQVSNGPAALPRLIDLGAQPRMVCAHGVWVHSHR